MPDIFFTADTHFNHGNIIELSNRPFTSVKEMDEAMIKNWNDRVKPGDIVYHLGDFAFIHSLEGVDEYRRRLNGQIQLILGNHDYRYIKNYRKWAWVGHYKEIKVGDQMIVLFHYAQRTWNGSHKGSWMLHGHSHGTLKRDWRVKSFDVGVDVWNFAPLSFDEVSDQVSKIPTKPTDLFNSQEHSEPSAPAPEE
jgi:calcineurin-like phosphoesterase family protein